MIKKRVIKPKPGTGVDRVYEGLRRVIVEQTLALGARLPEDAVATRFGVSRTVVREAIGRLVTDGLAYREANRGAWVASPSPAEADEIIAARRDLEAAVAKRLAKNLSPQGVERLRAHVRREEEAAADRPKAVRLAGEFHVLLAELTGNQIIRGYVADVVARSSLVFSAQATAHSVCCAAAEHLEIIDAIVGGDPAAVENRMLKHLDDFADRSRQLPGPAKEFAELSDAFLKPKRSPE